MQKLKLNTKLMDILLYVIGALHSNQVVGTEKITTKEYVGRLSIYLRSIGQYGPSPMLVPSYSSSEFPQAFAR
jgi:RAB protein geranylgeranyltransferase component A